MIVLHIAPINMSIANGLRFSVPGLVSSQNKYNSGNVALLNIENNNNLNKKEIDKYDFRFIPNSESICSLNEPFNTPDIVVFHGVYHKKFIKYYNELSKNNIPYVVVPRVSLTFQAQKQRYLKKKIGNFLFFKKFIKKAEKINFLTENEKSTSKNFKKESFVIGNGIRIPNEFAEHQNDPLKITYIGRLDINHKGLDILMDAIIKIKKELSAQNVKINLYGSDFRNGKKYLEKKIVKNNLEKVCSIKKPVFGDEKDQILKESNIFISPSRFEGHPMAVIEAMAYGIPCILTKGTNMVNELNRYDAGWEITLQSSNIAKQINTSLKRKDLLIEKGNNARKLVEDNYKWDTIAFKSLDEYKNIIGEI